MASWPVRPRVCRHRSRVAARKAGRGEDKSGKHRGQMLKQHVEMAMLRQQQKE